jgi:hypothetical protein
MMLPPPQPARNNALRKNRHTTLLRSIEAMPFHLSERRREWGELVFRSKNIPGANSVIPRHKHFSIYVRVPIKKVPEGDRG